MSVISEKDNQPRRSNKENIPDLADPRGSTAMKDKKESRPLQQHHLELGQEDIIDEVDANLNDNSAFRDKELEELQKEKEAIEYEKI